VHDDAGRSAVVVADNGNRSREVDAGADEGVDEADGRAVVEGEYRGRSQVGGAEEGLCRIGPGTLDADDVELVASSCCPIACWRRR
jgi:hypothetical protein